MYGARVVLVILPISEKLWIPGGTALWGDLSRGRRVIDAETRERMDALLDDIESGRFAREWVEEHRNGRPRLRERLEADAAHPIEEAGRRVRALMPWLEEEE